MVLVLNSGNHYRIGFIDGKTHNTILFDSNSSGSVNSRSGKRIDSFSSIKHQINMIMKRSGARYVYTNYLESAPLKFQQDVINCGPWILYFASLMFKKTEITQVSVNEVFNQMKTQEYGDVVGIQNIKRKLVLETLTSGTTELLKHANERCVGRANIAVMKI